MRKILDFVRTHTHLRSAAGLAAIADGLTTKIAISMDLARELNALAPEGIAGITIATAAKFIFTQYADKIVGPRVAIYTWLLCICVWGSAAASNTFVMLGAPPLSNILSMLGVVLIALHIIFKDAHHPIEPPPPQDHPIIEPPQQLNGD